MSRRDHVATSAIRGALASIANAEAVEVGPDELRATAIERSPHRIGAGEAARRYVSDDEATDVVRREIADLETAAVTYAAGGHADRAERASAEAQVLRAVVAETR